MATNKPSLMAYFETEVEKRKFMAACRMIGKSGSAVLRDLAVKFTKRVKEDEWGEE